MCPNWKIFRHGKELRSQSVRKKTVKFPFFRIIDKKKFTTEHKTNVKRKELKFILNRSFLENVLIILFPFQVFYKRFVSFYSIGSWVSYFINDIKWWTVVRKIVFILLLWTILSFNFRQMANLKTLGF